MLARPDHERALRRRRAVPAQHVATGAASARSAIIPGSGALALRVDQSTIAIDTYKLLTALEGTGKSANFTAEEIANAINVAQEGAGLLTASIFDARMAAFESRMEALRTDVKAEVKASQLQNLLWLSGIVLASNGMVIALLARIV